MKTNKALSMALGMTLAFAGSALGQATLGLPVASPGDQGRPTVTHVSVQQALPDAKDVKNAKATDAPCSSGTCACGNCASDCNIVCLKPWKCEDLEMKPAEHTPNCCGVHGLLWCPKKEENGDNGNGDKKNGNDKKNGKDEKKNGEEEKKDEEPEVLTPLMGMIQCINPDLYERMKCNGTKAYGWIQQGFTGNFDSPRDRLNYGVNFNNRSNDYQFNQGYFVLERVLDLDKKKDEFHVGFRADFFAGHDAPYFENAGLGLLDRFLGDRLEYSRLSEFGISLPQFYVDMHAPILTDRGIDVRVGRFYTLMGGELTPAPQTDFYSHTYEYFLNAFTHTGVMTTTHVADTLDLYNGLVRGWEVVFQDVNDVWAYHGGATWKSCDQRQIVAATWYTGPEQVQNNQNYRTVLSLYYTRKFGSHDQWRFVTGGLVAWEQNAATDPLTGNTQDAEWYNYTAYLFYTVDPRLILGVRGEWFRDDDGVRTAYANSDHGGARFNRPGYAGDFFDITLGFTWKPFQNLRVRPELRFDWFDGIAVDNSSSRPFNDQSDTFQTTAAIDLIWEF